MTTRFAAVLAGMLVLAACGMLPPAGAGDLDGEWRLVSGVHDGDPLPVPDRAPITMVIGGSQVGGTSACNHYGGELTLSGDRISIGAMTMTEMGCDPPIMEAESRYIAALAAVDRWTRADEALTLAGEDVELTYRFVAPTPDADLTGTAWRLDGLVDGDAVSSTMGDEPATLVLRDDGTLSGTTGCRTFDGTYELEDGAVRVIQLVNDDRACPDLRLQDEHVLAVLAGGFGYAIDGERLTLSAGRLGLLYVAAEE
jgi:heat shock protein HslJ